MCNPISYFKGTKSSYLKEIIGKTEGTFQETSETVTYVYEKNSEDVDTEIAKGVSALPQTSERSNGPLFGALLAMLGAVLAFSRKGKKVAE